jgi:hypothetical protein
MTADPAAADPDMSGLPAGEILLFASVLDRATRGGVEAEQLAVVLDMFCAIAGSPGGRIDLGVPGRPSVSASVGPARPTQVFDLIATSGPIGRIVLHPPELTGRWEPATMSALGGLADLTAERIERAIAAEGVRLAVGQLTSALDSRIMIEQSKGILAERLGVDVDEAFEVLRRQAREQRRHIADVAATVVASSPRQVRSGS